MSTMNQLVSRNIKFSKRVRPLVPALTKCPQKRGVIQKTIIETPKKPNSAKRKAAKVKLSNGRIIKCYIPGIRHRLSKHSVIMIRGGRAQDLIGVRYKAIFGKFDFFAPSGRVTRLSKFGLSSKQHKLSKNKIRPERVHTSYTRYSIKRKNKNLSSGKKVFQSEIEYLDADSDFSENKIVRISDSRNYFSDYTNRNSTIAFNSNAEPAHHTYLNLDLRTNNFSSVLTNSNSLGITNKKKVSLRIIKSDVINLSLVADLSSYLHKRS